MVLVHLLNTVRPRFSRVCVRHCASSEGSGGVVFPFRSAPRSALHGKIFCTIAAFARDCGNRRHFAAACAAVEMQTRVRKHGLNPAAHTPPWNVTAHFNVEHGTSRPAWPPRPSHLWLLRMPPTSNDHLEPSVQNRTSGIPPLTSAKHICALSGVRTRHPGRQGWRPGRRTSSGTCWGFRRPGRGWSWID